MSPSKTLYVRDEDVSVWEQAEHAAKSARQSVSSLVAAALRSHLSTLESHRDRAGQVTVDMRDDMRAWTEAFAGRWLIEPGDDNRGTEDAGACYGIALTAKGRIAVYSYHVNDRWPPHLGVYDNLDQAEAETSGLPKELLAAAASEMGEQRIVWRDI